jgi:mono/diheme cytochrome c family protein
MIKVLVAGLVGTIAGVVVMIVVIVLSGTTTSGASSVGVGALPLSTASLSSGPASTPTSTPPPDTGGGSTGGTDTLGNADNGKTIFTGSGGCGGCHALAAAGTTGAVGPALDDLKGDAAKAGEPLDAFIKSSIVDPGAFVAAGYSDGVMPTTFGSTLSASDIDDLVAFISSAQK